MDITKSENLREIAAGKWDGMIFKDINHTYREHYFLWLNDIGNAKCTDGESVAHLGERIIKTLTEIAIENDGKTVAVATHATPIRVSKAIIEYGSADKTNEVPWVSNASVTLYEYNDGKLECKMYSEDKHLKNLVTILPGNV